jgi:hypothetical protein
MPTTIAGKAIRAITTSTDGGITIKIEIQADISRQSRGAIQIDLQTDISRPSLKGALEWCC